MNQTKVLIFCPTAHYGGLDILFSTLGKQTYPHVLCIADELYDERAPLYNQLSLEGYIDNIVFLDTKIKEGNRRALAQAYNNAAEFAVEYNFDLLVSLQDYIFIPENGIEMFVEDYGNYENSLITGLVSLSEGPGDDAIKDTTGYFTIYNEPLTEAPTDISWHDVRGTNLYALNPDVFQCAPEHWEANWAAIPVSGLKQGVRWDTSYDEGIAYENIDFSKSWTKAFATATILDKRNHAVGIEHRKIWPKEEKDLERYNNRWMHEEKWGVNL